MKSLNRKIRLRPASVMAAVVVLSALASFQGWGQNEPQASSAGANKGVENSRINQRDRHGVNPTPMNQGNSQEDLRLSREIRRSVVNETNHFSLLAHNIKIITRGGKVTLRGPVKNNEEKMRIAAVVRSIAGTNAVSNLLEVKENR
ncbi:MAG TPA: BON domain-containing protein [Verrucomicrobiae bacterium]